MRFTPYIVLFASLGLGACASPPLMVPAASARLDLAPISLVETEPDVRRICESRIKEALQRHGFAIDRAGARVQVEVTFSQVTVSAAPAEEFPDGIHERFAPGSTPGAGGRPPDFTADLTATVLIEGKARTVKGSGTAMRVENFRNLAPNGAPSRIAACGIGAERLVTALVEEMRYAAP